MGKVGGSGKERGGGVGDKTISFYSVCDAEGRPEQLNSY